MNLLDKVAEPYYDWLNSEQFHWDYFLTFTSVDAMNRRSTEQAAKRYFERLHKTVLNTSDRGLMFWVGERYSKNRNDYHIHALLQLPASEKFRSEGRWFYKVLDANWQSTMGNHHKIIDGKVTWDVGNKYEEKYDSISKNRVNIRRYVKAKGAESYLCKYLFKTTNFPYDILH